MNDYYLYDQLINRLLNSSDPVSKRDIADYLNVKVKTVKRLKDNINEFGIIIDEISGVNGGYYISNRSIFKRSPLSKKDISVLENIRMIIQNDNSILNQNDCISVLDKLVRQTEPIDDIITSVSNGFPLKMPQEELLIYYNQLVFAIQNFQKCEMVYQKANSDSVESYIIDPFELVKRSSAWYVNCKKGQEKNDIRQFKLNRIIKLKVLNERFIKDSTYRYNSDSLKKIKMKLKIKNRSYVDELVIGKNPKITYIDKNTIILETEIEGEFIAYGFIHSLGQDCEVLEPSELRMRIKNDIEDALKLYEDK